MPATAGRALRIGAILPRLRRGTCRSSSDPSAKLRAASSMRRILLLLFLITLGCQRKPSVPPEVVARVGDRMVTLADFRRYLERNAGTDLSQMNAEVASALLDQYVEEVLLSEYAAAHSVEIPAEEIAAAVRKEAGSTVIEKRDEMRRQKLIANVTSELEEPSDIQVRDYYDQHQAEFQSPEELRVRQILVRDEALAAAIAASLKKGEKFEDLSARHSLAPNAKRGGDIGYISRGELPKMFEDVIFSLDPGEVSEAIRTDSTFHLFKVDERKPAGPVDFLTAAAMIRQRMKEDAIRDRITQLISQSRNELKVAVLTRRLPFKYAGTLPKSENE